MHKILIVWICYDGLMLGNDWSNLRHPSLSSKLKIIHFEIFLYCKNNS